MKTVVLSTAALLIAGSAAAQTAPAATTQTPPPAERPGSNLTRDLNSGPPAPATYLAPAPVTAAPAPAAAPPRSEPAATTPAPAAPAPRTAPAPASRTAERPVSPAPRPVERPPAASTPAPRVTPPPAAAAPAPASTGAPAPVPAVAAPSPPPPPPSVPTVTVLDASARAALPFTVDLPRGFEIVTGRPGPNFKIYTIRRGERSFVMVYAGPNSQFPIYSGDMVEAGSRVSVVATEGGARHAMEHLFRRATDPLEVHVWTMTLDGADRALAEQIAQTVDVR